MMTIMMTNAIGSEVRIIGGVVGVSSGIDKQSYMLTNRGQKFISHCNFCIVPQSRTLNSTLPQFLF